VDAGLRPRITCRARQVSRNLPGDGGSCQPVPIARPRGRPY